MKFIYFSVLFVNLLLCCFNLKLDLRRYSPSSVFWLLMLSMLLFPSLDDPYFDDVHAHPFSVPYTLDIITLLEAQLFIFVFLFTVFLVNITLSGHNYSQHLFFLNRYYESQKSNSQYKGLVFLVFLILLVIYAYIEVYLTFGSNLFNNLNFTERRESQSILSGFLTSYNLIIGSGLFFWLFLKKKYIYASVFFSFYLITFLLLGGSRQYLVLIFFPLFLDFIYKNKFGFYILVACSFFFQYFSKALEYLLYLRNLPGMQSRINSLIHFYSDDINIKSSNESDLRFAFYYFVKSGCSLDQFCSFLYFKRLLLFWFPSSLDFIRIKPLDFEYNMFSQYMMGREGTLHPTFFGSLYADSGWFVFPWYLFFFLIYLLTVPILKKYKGWAFYVSSGIFIYFYMMLSRGALYGPFVVLVFGLVFLWFAQNIPIIKIKYIFK